VGHQPNADPADDATFQCERDDPSVTVRVWVDLVVYDVDIVEAVM